jgi:hypothetical protein
MTKNIRIRLVATILAVLVVGFVNMMLNPPGTVPAGMPVIPGIVLLAVAMAIWWEPLKARLLRLDLIVMISAWIKPEAAKK